jgi:hypothetical protein
MLIMILLAVLFVFGLFVVEVAFFVDFIGFLDCFDTAGLRVNICNYCIVSYGYG